MSTVVLQGPSAHSLRYGISSASPLTTCHLLRRPLPSPPSTTRLFSVSARCLKLKPDDHLQWRREAVAALNSKRDYLAISHNSDPRSRGGLMTPECYADNPIFARINLDPLPQDVEIESRDKTLASTRPAPISIPEQKPGQSKFAYYFSIGRAYYGFYKTGIKNIWANWNEFSEIKGWIQPFTIVACARYGGGQWEKRNIDPRTGQKEIMPIPHIFRREFQLYYRTKHDLLKAIPFSLILLICGEFTPLVILALGNRVVPYTCRIPAQQRQSIDDALSRFAKWKQYMHALTSRSVPNPRHPFDFTTSRLEHLWRRDLLFAYLANQSRFARPLFPILSSFYFNVILYRRLSNYWERIFCDTILIRREGGFATLSPQDIYEYARNYGLISLFVIMEREVGHKKNYDFINEDLKAKLVPILEKEADAMFNEDFTRLKIAVHWMRAYRDTARWASSPDILAAVELMKENERMGMKPKDGKEEDEEKKIPGEEWRKEAVRKLNESRKGKRDGQL